LVITFLPIGAWLLTPLENRFPRVVTLPDQIDGIIVLGGGIDSLVSKGRRQVTLNDQGDRVVTLAALAKRYPSARLVYAGGRWSLGSDWLKEALPAKPALSSLGLDPERILLESQSANTRENAVYARELAQPKIGEKWLLVTSAWHMPRAVGVFRKVEWPVIPYPVDYRATGEYSWRSTFSLSQGLTSLSLALREWTALAKYRLWGWVETWLPGPENP
ncbi:MAG: YdcF family protein, partial [Deltaproteobacteria bacterium]|nr:YdcF family protein [Deltaproteobacteria bacterium]